ncbi:lamin tail domain-containing protein [Streptomyces sp. NPDC007901]|uniref:lamin tail domain-containing protein n=1 Tax=Streptomyces sp. NPDC007901 TaxID=3364785 RepID=UPI0036E62C3F
MSVSVSVTARRLGSATAVAAALVGALALPAAAAAPHAAAGPRDAVVISAVQHDVQGRAAFSNRALNREWVDVTNTSRRDVNLSGWTLSDADGQSYTFHHYRLEGRSTVRVHTGEGRDTMMDLYQDRRRSVWNHDSDTVTLRTDRGRYVDSASWGLHHRRDMDDRHAFAHGRDMDDRHNVDHRRDADDHRGFGRGWDADDRRNDDHRRDADDHRGFGHGRDADDRRNDDHRRDADEHRGFGQRH